MSATATAGEALEAAQRRFAASIRVSECALERQEPLDVLGELGDTRVPHVGTGSDNPRSLSVATRRYAEVDCGSRWPRMSPISLGRVPSSNCREAWV